MKKKFILLLFACMFIFTSKVNAACEYGIPSPEIYTNGSWTSDYIKNVKTSSDSCYGRNAKVTFSSGSYLPAGRFYIHGELYEDDPPGNDDELIKTYKGYNNGYNLISWEVGKEYNMGKVDSPGDQTCELYMKFKIETIDASPYTIMKRDLFRYTMCI